MSEKKIVLEVIGDAANGMRIIVQKNHVDGSLSLVFKKNDDPDGCRSSIVTLTMARVREWLLGIDREMKMQADALLYSGIDNQVRIIILRYAFCYCLP